MLVPIKELDKFTVLEALIVASTRTFSVCAVLHEKSIVAVPVPDPTPVATKVTPVVLEVAPIDIKFVLPTCAIAYVSPIVKLPALMVDNPIAVKFNASVAE